MSFDRVTLQDFFRTGQQDCANVFGKDEVRDALRDHPGATDRQILDVILDENYAVNDPETRQRWLAQQDDLERLDPARAWEFYQRGWADRALGYIRAWRAALEADRTEENPMMFRHRPNPTRHPMKTFTVVRINRDHADTYAVEGEGEAALERAIRIAGPDPRDEVEYTTVSSSDAGAARLEGGRRHAWRPVPGGARENPVADGFRAEILEGMAKAFWVTSWADYCEQMSPARRAKLREEGLIPGPGGDWMDAAPPMPPSAKLAAKRLAQAFEERNGATVSELLDRAMEADGGVAGRNEADLFGHYLAMQAMGHGVGWFDDHAEFPLEFPFHTEAYYDGRRLHVSVRGA